MLEQFIALREGLDSCWDIMSAISNKTRIDIISTLLEVNYKGMRAGEIVRHAQLSGPVVSHHLKILVNAELVGVYKKGTRNHYYMKMGGNWKRFVELFNQIEKLRLEELEELKNEKQSE